MLTPEIIANIDQYRLDFSRVFKGANVENLSSRW